MTFRDHFSKQAQTYAQHRPHYPAGLFEYLASLAPARELAWDCGTGNGQAACGLVRHFGRVVATDASAAQINQAQPQERVSYGVGQAERVSLASDRVDMIAVALAVHWFDLERFYQEARRVLKPEGVLAVWTYYLPVIEVEIDRLLTAYYEMLGDYWPERFHFVDERYQTLPFPFTELSPPTFAMTAEWDLNQIAGFLNSWSATRRYREANGRHPLDEIWPDLTAAWGETGRRRAIEWPMFLRIGKC
jgi:SAM-dependent methyltransferase